MCIGTIKENLIVRFDPKIQDDLLKQSGYHIMNFTNRPMKRSFVGLIAVDLDSDLGKWNQLALDFNPKSNKSKKRER